MKEINSVLKDSRIMRFFCVSFMALFLAAGPAFAQDQVSGTITDESGKPLAGALVTVEGTNRGAVSDNQGRYTINAATGDVLVFSLLGMSDQRIPYGGQTMLNVSMTDDLAMVDEVVVVGYGTQKRASITGAVSQIRGEELLKTTKGPISNMLAGRISGVNTYQTSGQPGLSGSQIQVRGQGTTPIVDGMPRAWDEIDPNDIETISVLKDASSASVYGMNSPSVIIVTTKRGSIGTPRITYNGSYGWSMNANMLDLLDGPGYAYWYNKALELDGNDPIFNSTHVANMLAGENGWGNTNWYKKTFGTGKQMNHSISVTGGNERAIYFLSLGMYDEKGNVKNYNYNRWNMRSNVEAKIAKNLTATFRVGGRVGDRHTPGYSADPRDWHNVGQQAIRAMPYLPVTMERDGEEYYVGSRTASNTLNPIAAVENTGYVKTKNYVLETNFALEYKAPWVEGLSAKFTAAYDYTFNEVKNLAQMMNYLTPVDGTSPTRVETMLTANPYFNEITYGRIPDPRNYGEDRLTESHSFSRLAVTQSQINFDRTFDKHKVSALALFETRENVSNYFSAAMQGFDFVELDDFNFAKEPINNNPIQGYRGHTRNAGLVFRLNYEYDNRYLFEFADRYDGSYLFAYKSGKRWVNLPAVSAGWRISNEEWFNVRWINNLKLRAGFGMTATTNSEIKAVTYLNLYQLSPTPSVVLGGSAQNILQAYTMANSNLTWEKMRAYNIGLETTMFNGMLSAEVDVFYKYLYDILGQASSSNATAPSWGGYIPTWYNNNKQDIKGFEFTLSHANRVGDFFYNVKLTGSYAYARWLKYGGDSENTPDIQKLTGKQVGSVRGFIDMGLFQTMEEIQNAATIPGSYVLPGYIRYRDVNGDGIISVDEDMGFVSGTPIPKFTGGLEISGAWKGLDFSMLFQAGLGRKVALTGQYTAWGSEGVMDNTFLTKPFYHGGNSPKFLVENSWRPDNTNADFPRLHISSSNNNAFSSTYWYRNGDYMRLKSAEIGYSFPSKWLNVIGIQKIRIYAQGSNLFTVSKLNKYNIDPEQPSVNNGYYPQQRVILMGINVSF